METITLEINKEKVVFNLNLLQKIYKTMDNKKIVFLMRKRFERAKYDKNS